MKKTAGELAKIVGGTLYGDPAVVIDDVRSAESGIVPCDFCKRFVR